MKNENKLVTARKETPEGFPLAVMILHQKDRKRENLAFCLEKHYTRFLIETVEGSNPSVSLF